MSDVIGFVLAALEVDQLDGGFFMVCMVSTVRSFAQILLRGSSYSLTCAPSESLEFQNDDGRVKDAKMRESIYLSRRTVFDCRQFDDGHIICVNQHGKGEDLQDKQAWPVAVSLVTRSIQKKLIMCWSRLHLLAT